MNKLEKKMRLRMAVEKMKECNQICLLKLN